MHVSQVRMKTAWTRNSPILQAPWLWLVLCFEACELYACLFRSQVSRPRSNRKQMPRPLCFMSCTAMFHYLSMGKTVKVPGNEKKRKKPNDGPLWMAMQKFIKTLACNPKPRFGVLKPGCCLALASGLLGLSTGEATWLLGPLISGSFAE